ncbi:hypothetical protein [Cystobacter fuscus]|uniref:hypothetical protein n=1 Tax=Cystobacter fuscus TaxID=43 RepID=UPI0037C063F4
MGALDLDAAHQETFVRTFRPALRQADDGARPYLVYWESQSHAAGGQLQTHHYNTHEEQGRLTKRESSS